MTVGFLVTMAFSVGQRSLPAFGGMRLLFSAKLVLLASLTLTVGCFLRVASEILAYREILHAAWTWLPVSAVFEMTSVTLFAVKLLVTFARPRQVELRSVQV